MSQNIHCTTLFVTFVLCALLLRLQEIHMACLRHFYRFLLLHCYRAF